MANSKLVHYEVFFDVLIADILISDATFKNVAWILSLAAINILGLYFISENNTTKRQSGKGIVACLDFTAFQ